MDILETRNNNIYNLKNLSQYIGCPTEDLIGYYNEILQDALFLDGINDCILSAVDNFGFKKGIFGRGILETIDWFGYQRVLIYVLVRHIKPEHILETGVYYGGNTAFLLAAIHKNNIGTLHSIDLPDSKIQSLRENSEENKNIARHSLVGDSEYYNNALSPGFIVPEYLKERWDFISGNSLDVIPAMNQEFGFYLHDSDHSFDFLNRELSLATKKLKKNAVIVVDDLTWSNSFYKYCSDRQLYPILATDNGKDGLMVRTGIIKLDHPYNLDI